MMRGMPADAVFSHLTAAHIHGLPIPHRLTGELVVHVSVADRASRPRRSGVVAHLVPSGTQRVVRVGGLLTTTAVDTWCALSTTLSLDELVVVGDALVRRTAPLATMEQLRSTVTRHAGRHGATRLRAASALVRPRTDAAPETELRLAIVRAALPEPVINGWVVSQSGRFRARSPELAVSRGRPRAGRRIRGIR